MPELSNVSNSNEHILKTQIPTLKPDHLLSYELRLILQWLIFSVMCQTVVIFGVVSNIINIICFTRQGFKITVNVSFMGLAISDLGCLTTLLWSNICLTPAFSDADLPFDALEFQYLTSGWPHATFSRVTSWITALITLERCLCITVPLKVKNLVTPKRVLAIIIAIFIILISAIAPMYVVYRLDFKFVPAKNKTLLGLASTENREKVETVSFAINNVFIPITAFVVIIICTIILVFTLHKSREWQKKSTFESKVVTSNRNQKVAKIVVMISTLFIACFTPFSIVFIAMLFEPGLSIDGKYQNTVIVLIGVGIFLESINSASNIFIYYNMSSKYRYVFRQLFHSEGYKE